MASIKYILVNGIPPITVSITPAVQPDQIKNILGPYFFANLSDGTYTIRATDITGCWDEITATINCSTTSTTSTSTTCYVGAALNQVNCDDWDICEGCYEYLLQNTSETETARFYVITCADVATTVDILPSSQLELCLSACMVYPLNGYGIATRTEDCTPATSTSTSTVEPTTSTSTTVEPTTTTSTTEEPTTTTTSTTIIEPETDYGFLYNWWAAIGDTDGDDVADTSIANTGWRLPTETDVDTLLNALYGIEELGSTPAEEEDTCLALQSSGNTYWTNGGNNSSGMDMRGCGGRHYSTGAFQDLNNYAYFVTSTITFSIYFRSYSIVDASSTISRSNGQKKQGRNVRLIKNSTTLQDGETGTYTGNNGISYPTICIGTQEWLAANLEETKFRDGSNIPYIDNEDAGDDALWAAATSAAYCIYPIT